MIYLELFLSFLKIGLFSFGGGYAAMPLISEEIVLNKMWLTTTEFNDLITISQMTPGPIAVNSATFVGVNVGGILGAIIATIACILPSIIIVLTLSYLYLKYRNLSSIKNVLNILRPSVIAMILVSGILILIEAIYLNGLINIKLVSLFLLAILALKYLKFNPILLMILCGVFNILININL